MSDSLEIQGGALRRSARGRTEGSPSDESWQQGEEMIVFGPTLASGRGFPPLVETVPHEMIAGYDGTNTEGGDGNTVDQDSLPEDLTHDSRDGGSAGPPEGYDPGDDYEDREITSHASSTHSVGDDGSGERELARLRQMVLLGPRHCRCVMRINDDQGRGVSAICGGPFDDCPRPRHTQREDGRRGLVGYYDALPTGRRGYVDGRRPDLGLPMREEDRQALIEELTLQRQEEPLVVEQRPVFPPTGSPRPRTTPESFYTAHEDIRPATVTFGPGRILNPSYPTAPTPQTTNLRSHRVSARPQWYGILRRGIPWRICEGEEAAADMVFSCEGTQLAEEVFSSQEAAKSWQLEGLRRGNSAGPTVVPFPRENSRVTDRVPVPVTVTEQVPNQFPGTSHSLSREGQKIFYYQVVLPSGQRLLASTVEELTLYLQAGGTCVGTTQMVEHGQRWVQFGTQVGVNERSPGSRRTVDLTGLEQPSSGLDHTKSYGYIGEDDSSGNEIYGLDVNRILQFQSKLVPEGMCAADAEKLIGLAADPTACPRRHGSTRGATTQENVMEMVSDTMHHMSDFFYHSKGKGSHRWALSSENGAMEKAVKTLDGLERVYDSYMRAWDRDIRNQDSLMRTFLCSAGYSNDLIESWLRSGLLPTIIRKTGEYHYRLLGKMMADGQKQLDFGWKKSPARAELNSYLEDIQDWRSNAGGHANFIAQVYLRYRNGFRSGFRSDEQTRAMLNLLHDAYADRPDGAELRAKAAPKAEGDNCKHCNRTKLVCPGGSNCVFGAVPSGKVRRCIRGFSNKVAKRAAGLFKKAREARPDDDPLTALEEAAAEAKSDDA